MITAEDFKIKKEKLDIIKNKKVDSMRIVAGTARGIRLKMVPGNHVRPTADRVKESLFNVLGPFFDGGNVLDLFAGTGGLGIEALSRGMEYAVFIDKSSASTAVVQENLKKSKLNEKAETHSCDARVALKKLKERGICFQIIFMDPPYHDELIIKLLEVVSEYGLLSRDGVIIAEHAKDFYMPKEIATLERTRSLSYGNTFMSLYYIKKGQ